MDENPPRYIQWSTDHIDTNDPFQRRWLMRQILMYGRAEDIRKLDLNEIARELDGLNLPAEIYDLWSNFLESRNERRAD